MIDKIISKILDNCSFYCLKSFSFLNNNTQYKIKLNFFYI